MKKDLELNLYNQYLKGDKKAFELLYNKYKNKIQYFIFNIIKDYQKSEDITQETFIYILQNRPRNDCSFKHYIYLVAKSRAYNYVNTEKRRTEIDEKTTKSGAFSVMKRAALIMETFPICLKFPVKSPFFRGKYLTKKKGAYIYIIVS